MLCIIIPLAVIIAVGATVFILNGGSTTTVTTTTYYKTGNRSGKSKSNNSKKYESNSNKTHSKPINDSNNKQEKSGYIPKIKLSDIAGLDEAKSALEERVILPLKHKSLYDKYGKTTGGGILLFGLPGTGKTMFAQAVATELDAKFFSIKCSDIESK
jgi:SpoVK/Ycf46/Vps4 family AAA+-type ATPase